jgi:16S rRNA G966 N2-methylase RsmD
MSGLALPASPVSRDHADTVPDTPIEVSISYHPRGKGASRHFGFLPFFAKKPWQVVQEYIKHYTRAGDLVGDPFSGSGVTAVEALVLGRRAVTSDINPVARLITRMTAIAPVNLEDLNEAFEQVRAIARAPIEALDRMDESDVFALLQTLDYPRDPIPTGVRRAGIASVDGLHTPRQLAGLTILRDAINQAGDVVSRDLLRIALANTARYANLMYILPYDSKGRRRSPYRGDVGFLRRFSYSPASPDRFYELSVWPTFERAFGGVREAKKETNRLIGGRYEGGFVLSDVPAARFHEAAGESTLDYCFTDPPYSNEIRFLDLSTLWAAWLNLPIDDAARRAELLIDPPRGKTREHFEREFAASAESISRALKDGCWFTLVYKHRDLSLWQAIRAACEDSGLRYVHSVWQDVRIPSTRQNESPNINPNSASCLSARSRQSTGALRC